MTDQKTYYETMYILRPDIAEDAVNNHIDKYNKLLEDFGGKVLDSQMRGKRRLAYQIAKHREGIYVQLSHQGDGQHIFKIEKAMRLNDDVIRYMTVKQHGSLPAPRSSNKSPSKAEIKEKDIPDSNNVKREDKPKENEIKPGTEVLTSKKETSEIKPGTEVLTSKKETSEIKETAQS